MLYNDTLTLAYSLALLLPRLIFFQLSISDTPHENLLAMALVVDQALLLLPLQQQYILPALRELYCILPMQHMTVVPTQDH